MRSVIFSSSGYRCADTVSGVLTALPGPFLPAMASCDYSSRRRDRRPVSRGAGPSSAAPHNSLNTAVSGIPNRPVPVPQPATLAAGTADIRIVGVESQDMLDHSLWGQAQRELGWVSSPRT
jgi:hypothetical protein